MSNNVRNQQLYNPERQRTQREPVCGGQVGSVHTGRCSGVCGVHRNRSNVLWVVCYPCWVPVNGVE